MTPKLYTHIVTGNNKLQLIYRNFFSPTPEQPHLTQQTCGKKRPEKEKTITYAVAKRGANVVQPQS